MINKINLLNNISIEELIINYNFHQFYDEIYKFKFPSSLSFIEIRNIYNNNNNNNWICKHIIENNFVEISDDRSSRKFKKKNT